MSLLNNFRRYFVNIEIHREPEYDDSIGNLSDEGTYSFSHEIEGYIQPTGGSYAQSNQRNFENITAILYTQLDADVVANDRVVLEGYTYQVQNESPKGVSGILDHQEIPLIDLKDVDLSV